MVTVNLVKLMATYTHATIFKWYKANILKKSTPTLNCGDENGDVAMNTSKKINKYKFLEKLAQKFTIDGSAQFEHVSTAVRLEDDSRSSISVKHLKLNFHQASGAKGDVAFSCCVIETSSGDELFQLITGGRSKC